MSKFQTNIVRNFFKVLGNPDQEHDVIGINLVGAI